MINGKRVLGLVLARAGSKGLPGKNILPLRGRPLIAWSIAAGLASRYVDDVVVSTDGEEIAEVARQHGAEVPFLRPAHLASDTAASIDAVEHALAWLEHRGRRYDYLVLLEPTSPLRDSADIDLLLERMVATDALSAVTVCRSESQHPAFMYELGENSRLQPFLQRQPTSLRRQDINAVYFLDGNVYASEVGELRSRRSFYHQDTMGLEMPKWKATEIDDEVDLLIVDTLMRHRGIGK